MCFSLTWMTTRGGMLLTGFDLSVKFGCQWVSQSHWSSHKLLILLQKLNKYNLYSQWHIWCHVFSYLHRWRDCYYARYSRFSLSFRFSGNSSRTEVSFYSREKINNVFLLSQVMREIISTSSTKERRMYVSLMYFRNQQHSFCTMTLVLTHTQAFQFKRRQAPKFESLSCFFPPGIWQAYFATLFLYCLYAIFLSFVTWLFRFLLSNTLAMPTLIEIGF